MRNLTIQRVRALACFAIPYHCILEEDPESHLLRIRSLDRESLMRSHDSFTMRNGETCRLSIEEKASTLFVIAYLEHGELLSETLPIPEGAEDLYYTVETRYNGDSQLSLVLLPGAQD